MVSIDLAFILAFHYRVSKHKHTGIKYIIILHISVFESIEKKHVRMLYNSA